MKILKLKIIILIEEVLTKSNNYSEFFRFIEDNKNSEYFVGASIF
jgi:hypothetical protein